MRLRGYFYHFLVSKHYHATLSTSLLRSWLLNILFSSHLVSFRCQMILRQLPPWYNTTHNEDLASDISDCYEQLCVCQTRLPTIHVRCCPLSGHSVFSAGNRDWAWEPRPTALLTSQGVVSFYRSLAQVSRARRSRQKAQRRSSVKAQRILRAPRVARPCKEFVVMLFCSKDNYLRAFRGISIARPGQAIGEKARVRFVATVALYMGFLSIWIEYVRSKVRSFDNLCNSLERSFNDFYSFIGLHSLE